MSEHGSITDESMAQQQPSNGTGLHNDRVVTPGVIRDTKVAVPTGTGPLVLPGRPKTTAPRVRKPHQYRKPQTPWPGAPAGFAKFPAWIAHAGILQKLTKAALLVLHAILDAIRHSEAQPWLRVGECCPSMTTLSHWTGISRPKVARAVAALVERGVLLVRKIGPSDPGYPGRNGWEYNVYRIAEGPNNHRTP